MRIVRSPRDRRFTSVPNQLARDDRLSLKARGLLLLLLSYPDWWSSSAEALAKQGPDGRDAVRSGLTELERVGYLTRVRRQGDRGRWLTECYITDTPDPPSGRHTDTPRPVDNPVDNPAPPRTGFPASDNPSLKALKTNYRKPPYPQRAPDCDPAHPVHRSCRACGTDRRALLTQLTALPPWCGTCDTPDSRFVATDDGRVTRCPRCHPLAAAIRQEPPDDARERTTA